MSDLHNLSIEDFSKQASSIDDLSAWLTKNPDTVLGEMQLPDGAYVGLVPSIDWTTAAYTTFENETLAIDVDIEISYGISSEPVRKLLYSSDDNPLVHFNHVARLSLPLSEWPLATALIVGHYVSDQHHHRDRPWLEQWEQDLEKVLAIHFPKVTLATVRSIAEGGLLPTNMNGKVSIDSVMEMLFASRKLSPDLSAPFDLA